MINEKLLATSILAFSIALIAPPIAQASTTAGSSAAQGASSAAGSASDSIGQSSNSSSKTTGVAAGDYKIIEVLAHANKPDYLVVRLQAIDANNATGQFELTLPLIAFAKSSLKVGETVAATTQIYGTKFANAKTQTTFFLVFRDEVQREFESVQIAG